MNKKIALGGWAAVLPLAAAIGVYLFFVFVPAIGEIRRLRDEMVAQQATLQAAKSLPAQVAAIDDEMQATREYLVARRGVSAKPAEVAKLFGLLSAEIKASGAATTAFRPEPKTELAVLDRVPLTLGCRGKFEQIETLLSAVERLDRPIWIEEAVLERDRQDGRLVSCELKLAIFADKFEFSH